MTIRASIQQLKMTTKHKKTKNIIFVGIKYIIILYTGIFIGLNFSYFNTNKQQIDGESNNELLLQQQQQQQQQQQKEVGQGKVKQPYNDNTIMETTVENNNHENNGFKTVHVYYGPKDAIEYLHSSSSLLKQNYKAGSQVDQDLIISTLITQYYTIMNKESSNNNSNNNNNNDNINKHRPFFIDLAANDAIQLSNTLTLEKQGWDGLCIEPNPIYWYRLSHRKCTIVASFVGSKDLEQVDVSLNNEEYGGIIKDGMDNIPSKRGKNEKRYTIKFQTLLQEFNVPKIIDYLSLDVEGAEYIIMQYFPFSGYKINFITIERPRPNLQSLLQENGYVFVIMIVYWGETLWVHESILKDISIKDIQDIVLKTSNYPKQIPSDGVMTYSIDTGHYGRKKTHH